MRESARAKAGTKSRPSFFRRKRSARAPTRLGHFVRGLPQLPRFPLYTGFRRASQAPTAPSRAPAAPPTELLEQAREPAVLEDPPLRLAGGAVRDHVLLEVDALELGAAARARLALAPVDLERHRELVGNRERNRALVVVDRRAENLDRSRSQCVRLARREVVAAL